MEPVSLWVNWLTLVLCPFGIVGNTLSLVVLTRPKMRTPLNVILVGLSIFDGLFVALALRYMLAFVDVLSLDERSWSIMFAFLTTGEIQVQRNLILFLYLLKGGHIKYFVHILFSIQLKLDLFIALWGFRWNDSLQFIIHSKPESCSQSEDQGSFYFSTCLGISSPQFRELNDFILQSSFKFGFHSQFCYS